MAMKIFPSY